MMNKESSLSRRNFLTAAALGSAGLIAGGMLAGCTNAASQTAAATEETFDEEFDVVVVGSGIAGLSAAITVAQEGKGATCLLAEKGATASGCSPVCSGDSIYDTNLQYLKDMAMTPLGTSIPDDVLEAFYEGIKENRDWTIALGATEDQLVSRNPGEGTAEYREFESNMYCGFWFNSKNEPPFNHFQNFLEHVRQEQFSDAIDFRTKSPLEDLIQDPGTKRIIGAVIDGKRIKANKGVIMCLGGYEKNAEMLESYNGVGTAISFCLDGNTGDGHKICSKIGADFWHMHNCAGFWLAPRNLDNTNFSNGALKSHEFKKFGITVGTNGRRFYMDWDGHKSIDTVNDEWSEGELALHVGSRHGVMQFGGEWNHLPMPSKAWFIFDQAAYEAGAFDFETAGTQDPVADGWLLKADTIEELAAAIESPVDQLVKTVSTWNAFCEDGEDLAFFRPSDTLSPIATPPFYAQLCAPAMLNTDGGPKRSAKGEVIDIDGNPIPGLYSAGEFGSVWGHLYQGCGNVAEAMAFGRISARNCMQSEG